MKNPNTFSKKKIQEICKKTDVDIVDGFIYVKYNINNISIDYFNNDGSWETFCLNGLRCVALLMRTILKKTVIEIEMNNIIYKTKVHSDNCVSVFC